MNVLTLVDNRYLIHLAVGRAFFVMLIIHSSSLHNRAKQRERVVLNVVKVEQVQHQIISLFFN